MSATPIQLSQANLPKIATGVKVPSYDRTKGGRSIAHIGVGGFHRAHQAVYLDDLLHQQEGWRLSGIGLLPHDAAMRDTLARQDCLYTVVERDPNGDQARVIGSLQEFLFAPDGRERVLSKLTSADTPIVSLTITENGYYVNQATGAFNDTHPDIQHDLAHSHEPNCSFGYLIEALDRRRTAGLPPFTVLSCDNLQNNGEMAHRMLMAFAELRDPTLRNWIESNGSFPNTMVDRITPATSQEHRNYVAHRFAIEDGWPVVCEPFRQWVIEDHFPLGRPAWELVGAQMTTNVLPYELIKLRLLNASHQALCYIGILLGYELVHEAMQDSGVRELVRRMMDDEVTSLLLPVPGVDLSSYKAKVIERFSNSVIQDTLIRLATDGSARIPKFVLPSIAQQIERGGPIRILSFVVASWFRYLSGRGETGKELTIIDPLAQTLQERARTGERDPRPLLGMQELFGETLTNSERFVSEVGKWLASFYDLGARKTLEIL
jgi:mannitol 2-dehydrogenase